MVKTPYVVLLSLIGFTLGYAFGTRGGEERGLDSSRRIYGVVSDGCQKEIDEAARDPDLHGATR